MATPSGKISTEAFDSWEEEVIGIFVSVSEVLGIPRSVGEIYGFVYAAPEPVSLDDVVTHLRISKGSASQGLRFLRGIAAVKTVYKTGKRKALFSPELELRVLVAGLLRERLLPFLDQLNQRLPHSPDAAAVPPANLPHIEARTAKLRAWQQQAATLLPLVSRVMS